MKEHQYFLTWREGSFRNGQIKDGFVFQAASLITTGVRSRLLRDRPVRYVTLTILPYHEQLDGSSGGHMHLRHADADAATVSAGAWARLLARLRQLKRSLLFFSTF